MNLFTIGLILDTLGKIFIGLAVFMVHRHIFHERKIDLDVLKVMYREWFLTVFGILQIIMGAILQLIYHFE